jgi:hypothetical protein
MPGFHLSAFDEVRGKSAAATDPVLLSDAYSYGDPAA